ncbi:periplasmic heavy metal sensor [Candidatus Desantisbacteria bacterium]|nr:periplasmic heavy metal sensor [Candidatus Desantisbacteria bacterium]
MRRILQSLIMVAVGVMIIVPTVSAQSPAPMMGHRKQVEKDMFQKLNLTAEQKVKIKQNRREQQGKIEDLMDALQEKQAALRDKLSDPNVSREGVAPIATEVKSLQAKLIDCRIDGIFAVKEILTPEQYAKFQEELKGKKEDRQERREQWKEQRRDKKQRCPGMDQ